MLSVRGRQRGEQESDSARAKCLFNFLRGPLLRGMNSGAAACVKAVGEKPPIVTPVTHEAA
jgi:hypothetical protein